MINHVFDTKYAESNNSVRKPSYCMQISSQAICYSAAFLPYTYLKNGFAVFNLVFVYHSSNTRECVNIERCGHMVTPHHCAVKNFIGRYSRERLERVQLL